MIDLIKQPSPIIPVNQTQTNKQTLSTQRETSRLQTQTRKLGPLNQGLHSLLIPDQSEQCCLNHSILPHLS